MSDNLKTGLNVPSFIFTDGGLPEAVVFNTIFQAVRQGFADAKNVFGPIIKTAGVVENKSYVVSSDTYNSKMAGTLEGKKATFRATANELITNSFNLARIIGPHASLNPIYLPGTVHSRTTQGSGWPLLSNTLEQQLPFPPVPGTPYPIAGGSWLRQTNLSNVYSGGGNRYYVDEITGVLYSNNFFTQGESLKYDLRIPNNENYLGAGYNVIPDLSITSLSLATREALTGTAGDFGAVRVEFVEGSASNDTSRWMIEFPKVISARESLLNYADLSNSRKITNSGFEPVGRYHAGTESKRYCLRDAGTGGDLVQSQIYAGEFLDENLVYLYDSKQHVSYDIALERHINPDYWYKFYFNLPYAAMNVLTDHNDNLLANNSGTYNTQDFFIFVIQTNLSESIAQVGANFSRHTHDGLNSKKISHKNLSNNDADMPVPKDYKGESGGLDVINFSRRFMRALAGTGIPSNDVHPQYFNRLGYAFGGTAGHYRKGINNPRELNMMHGDIVFSPLHNSPKPYIYGTGDEANADVESITWDLNGGPSPALRSHALVFGTPKQSTSTTLRLYAGMPTINIIGSGTGLTVNVQIVENAINVAYSLVSVTLGGEGTGYLINNTFLVKGTDLGGLSPTNDLICRVTSDVGGLVAGIEVVSGLQAFHYPSSLANDTGATKIYYESNIFTTDGGYDKQGLLYSLRRHGFVPGNLTNPGTGYSKGMNIGWGNLFFGYREDIFNGRLKAVNPATAGAASAYWRTSEFNIITTGNGKSGTNTNSAIKENYSYRDGFAVRGLAGGNIWLSVGADMTDDSFPTSAKNNFGKPGVIALEASTHPTNPGTSYQLGLKTEDFAKDVYGSGAGVFAAPSLTTAGKVPWSIDTTTYTFPDKSPYLFANLWNNDVITSNTNLQEGGLLDIFALASDHNRFAVDSLTSYTSSLENTPIGVDKSLTGWVQGRPFLRGTYGINFCLSGSLVNLSAVFKTGFQNKEAEDAWGPGTAILAVTGNEYLHREFRFWGKNSEISASPSSDSLENTVGGNLNLLYNFGRNYKRFGLSKAWSNNNLHGSTATSLWANSRSIALGSSKPENYGSAIRGASFVDAFVGVRNDPHQPYLATYIFPFEVDFDSGMDITSGAYLANGDPDIAFGQPGGITYNPLDNDYTYPQVVDGGTLFNSIDGQIHFDALLRGLEQIVRENSGPSAELKFSINVQLKYASYQSNGSVSQDYGTWTDDIATGNTSLGYRSGICGYNCFLTTVDKVLDGPRAAYLAKFPLTDQASTKNWGLKFVWETPSDEGLYWYSGNQKFYTPFRWEVSSNALYQRVSGTIVINVITAYHSS